ncbi:hypothetical protein L1987_20855 [Smallanthus sonchifolius]|uniref:Uncharacterized protein n=1 Tax=Smallanthus sonchifolius TaxID=185202 RepID=A0ACB9ITY5_9ASTR|nr:hypothetical protein L1987_20855 [Smallanthus sonchifolius]
MPEGDDRAPSVERAPSNEDHEENFTFEPEVQAALAREINGILKSSLPMLVDSLKKANGDAVDNSSSGPAMNDESDEEYVGGPGYEVDEVG